MQVNNSRDVKECLICKVAGGPQILNTQIPQTFINMPMCKVKRYHYFNQGAQMCL
jgi:hypothetical protein